MSSDDSEDFINRETGDKKGGDDQAGWFTTDVNKSGGPKLPKKRKQEFTWLVNAIYKIKWPTRAS